MTRRPAFFSFDLAEPLNAGRQAEMRRTQNLCVTIFVSEQADTALVMAIKNAFVPELTSSTVVVRPLEPGSMPPVDSDLCVVVPDDGGELALRCARSSADVGVPCRVIVETSLEVHDLGPDGANGLAGYIVASDPQAALTEFADWVIQACPDTGLALAANFSFLRSAKISEIIRRYSKENALIGAISLIPGADLPIMTVNQFRMAFEIAAACGVRLRITRITDLAGILGAGFAYRSLARSLVSAIPIVGWAIKGGVGYLGTQTTGHALALRYCGSAGANSRP